MGLKTIIRDFVKSLITIISYVYSAGVFFNGLKTFYDNYIHEHILYSDAKAVVRQCDMHEINSGQLCSDSRVIIQKSPILEALGKTFDFSLLCFGDSCSYYFRGLTEGWTLITLTALLGILFLLYSLRRFETNPERFHDYRNFALNNDHREVSLPIANEKKRD